MIAFTYWLVSGLQRTIVTLQQDAFVEKVTIIKDKFCEFIYDMS